MSLSSDLTDSEKSSIMRLPLMMFSPLDGSLPFSYSQPWTPQVIRLRCLSSIKIPSSCFKTISEFSEYLSILLSLYLDHCLSEDWMLESIDYFLLCQFLSA